MAGYNFGEGYDVGFAAGIAIASQVVKKYKDEDKIQEVLRKIFLEGAVKEESNGDE